MLSGPELQPLTKKISSVAILLHGYGSDGNNLISLAEELRPSLPETHFIAPNGMFPFENASFGYQWFGLNDRSEPSLLKGLNYGMPKVNDFIDYQLQRFNLPIERLALIGFSQGAMLSLHTALRRPDKVAAVIAFSGMVIGPQFLSNEIKSYPPVTLIHGALDEVIPVSAAYNTELILKSLNVPVEMLIEPILGHSIGQAGLNLAIKNLKHQFESK
jgi:phospholipase/carboxylesterase